MAARTHRINEFILRHAHQHPADLTSFVAAHFRITRQAAHRHIQNLVEANVLRVEGTRKNARYSLIASSHASHLALSDTKAEDVVYDRHVAPHLQGLSKNVTDICAYGFTEMCNNVIDHSAGNRLLVEIERTAISVALTIADDGVGIFKKIKDALNLPDERAAIFELSKGKFTTDPTRHSGQGIFFTSRVFDTFYILSGDLFFAHNLGQDDGDWLLETRPPSPGTRVHMMISISSTRTLKQVFDQFASTDGEYSFSKTHVPLSLAQHEGGILISRSQAKRILARFESFEEVWLDFKDIPAIGQSFADEIFRVFRQHNPQIKIVWTNANTDVEQMIRRAMSEELPEIPGQLKLF